MSSLKLMETVAMDRVRTQLIYIFWISLLIQSCSALNQNENSRSNGGKSDVTQDPRESPPVPVAGTNLLSLENSNLRCVTKREESTTYASECYLTAFDKLSGNEFRAQQLPANLSVSWKLPSMENSTLENLSCLETTAASVSQKCRFDKTSSKEMLVEFNTTLLSANKKKELKDTVLLSYSVKTSGLIPELPFSYELPATEAKPLGFAPRSFSPARIFSYLGAQTRRACFVQNQLFFALASKDFIYTFNEKGVSLFASKKIDAKIDSYFPRFQLDLAPAGSNDPPNFDQFEDMKLSCGQDRIYAHLKSGELISITLDGEITSLLKPGPGAPSHLQAAATFPYQPSKVLAQHFNGELYFTQRSTNGTHQIWKVNKTGLVEHVAGRFDLASPPIDSKNPRAIGGFTFRKLGFRTGYTSLFVLATKPGEAHLLEITSENNFITVVKSTGSESDSLLASSFDFVFSKDGQRLRSLSSPSPLNYQVKEFDLN